MPDWVNCLFIGGCADGEFHTVHPDDRIVPMYERPPMPAIWSEPPQGMQMCPSPKRHLYEQQKFWFDDKGEWETIYVVRDMTPRQAFQALITGYKRIDRRRGPVRYTGDDR